jgi:hypothetical protein
MFYSSVVNLRIMAMISNQNNKKSSHSQHFFYFNAQGESLGTSQGNAPDHSLYQKAHYVLLNEEVLLKNEDPIAIIEQDIAAYSRELIKTSVTQMEHIMSLNKIIGALRSFLEMKKEHRLPAI